MQSFQASEVFVLGSTDQCEGWIVFRWPDVENEWECLQIDFDGHCSRRMPILSGFRLSDIALTRHHVQVMFSAELSDKLGLERVIQIAFRLSDEAFAQLQSGVNCITWPASAV